MRQILICLVTAATISSAAFVAVSTSRDAADELTPARGVVFHDANGNGRHLNNFGGMFPHHVTTEHTIGRPLHDEFQQTTRT